VILISFRQRKQEPVVGAKSDTNILAVTDTVPGVNEPNEKGYIIDVKQINGKINGKSTVVIKDKNGKEVKRLSLDEWSKDESNYENYMVNCHLHRRLRFPRSPCSAGCT
jgi:hypothetical protein